MRENSPAVPAGPVVNEDHVDHEAWLQPIPESQRTRKVSGQFWIWAARTSPRLTGCLAPWGSIWAWDSLILSSFWFWGT